MTLLAARVRSLQRRLHGQESSYGPRHSDPDTVARRVLEYCRKDLGLPADMRTCFCDTDASWGVVFENNPRVLHLNKRLRDEPQLRHQLIESTAHEARHARAILDGRLEYDLHAERIATDYGRAVAAAWRFHD